MKDIIHNNAGRDKILEDYITNAIKYGSSYEDVSKAFQEIMDQIKKTTEQDTRKEEIYENITNLINELITLECVNLTPLSPNDVKDIFEKTFKLTKIAVSALDRLDNYNNESIKGYRKVDNDTDSLFSDKINSIINNFLTPFNAKKDNAATATTDIDEVIADWLEKLG